MVMYSCAASCSQLEHAKSDYWLRDSLDNGAKRRLSLGFSNPIFEDVDNGTLPMVTDADSPPSDGNLVTDMDRSKRTKKAGANSHSLGSAGSLEESVRSQ
jgi:hypothetical protein